MTRRLKYSNLPQVTNQANLSYDDEFHVSNADKRSSLNVWLSAAIRMMTGGYTEIDPSSHTFITPYAATVMAAIDAEAQKIAFGIPTISPFAETWLDDVTAAIARTTLGIAENETINWTDDLVTHFSSGSITIDNVLAVAERVGTLIQLYVYFEITALSSPANLFTITGVPWAGVNTGILPPTFDLITIILPAGTNTHKFWVEVLPNQKTLRIDCGTNTNGTTSNCGGQLEVGSIVIINATYEGIIP